MSFGGLAFQGVVTLLRSGAVAVVVLLVLMGELGS